MRRKTTTWVRLATAAGLACLGAGHATGQVRINELTAGRSDRLVQWSDAGVARLGAGPAWYEAGFDDRSWREAPGGFGFSDAYATNVRTNLYNLTVALYARQTFSVSAADAVRTNQVDLVIAYDDGFVAFLNGREVARRNLGAAGSLVYHDQQAFNIRTTPATNTIHLGTAKTLLQPGLNVLAIQVHNVELDDADLALVANLQLAGSPATVFVRNGNPWRYLPGLHEPSGGERDPAFAPGVQPLRVAWASPYFDDRAWARGPGGIGYGDGDDATDVGAQMLRKTPALYLRQAFVVSAATAALTNRLQLTMDYDDGFVAYLNGEEVARRNLGLANEFIARTRTATTHEAGAPETIVLGAARHCLRPGTNVLAIQVHNDGVSSSDLSSSADLAVAGSPAVTLVQHAQSWAYWVEAAEPAPPPEPAPTEIESDFMDWVELVNTSSVPISLAGWTLTDDAAAPGLWTFPDLLLASGQHLVVFCTGYDRRNPAAPYLHTNFKLDRGGEYLGLGNATGGLVATLTFPKQSRTHSYGWREGAGYRYCATATPGAANTVGAALEGLVAKPAFSRQPGFSSAAVVVALTCATPGATLRYTVDGTEPTLANGSTYTAALSLSVSTALRVRGFRDNWVPSPEATATYIVAEPAGVASMPALALVGNFQRIIHKPHGVASIVGGSWVSGLWVAGTENDYNIPMEHGRPFERPISAEWLWPGSDRYTQADCGIRCAGSRHIRPRYTLQNMSGRWDDPDLNKPQFNLYFRDDYGDGLLDFALFDLSALDKHKTLRLRGGKNDWKNPFIRDELTRRLFHDMGQVSSVGTLSAVYLNGQFKGYYNPCERYDEDFLQRSYRSENGWDVVNHDPDDLTSGDLVAWTAAQAFADTHSMAVLSNYQQMAALLDVENFADYLVLNSYAGTWDWPQNNWYAARERSTYGRFRYYIWDAEGAFGQAADHPVTYNTFTTDLKARTDRIPAFYRALAASPEFKLVFADRVQKHFFNSGALVEARVQARFEELRAALDPMMQYYWNQTVTRAWFDTWMAQRRGIYFPQLRAEGLWPTLPAPTFAHPGGSVTQGFAVAIAGVTTGALASAVVYYTLDGTDPRAPGGTAQGAAYAAPVRLDCSRTVKARLYLNGGWSPLAQATYLSGLPPLVVSEIMYNPAGGGDYEFIELQNGGATPVSLVGLAFTEGISFDFANASTSSVPPGGYVVLVKSRAAFAARYTNSAAVVVGEFGGQLDNAGEGLMLRHADFGTLLSFSYSDGWYPHTDGAGFSLTIRDPRADTATWALKTAWRTSAWPGGTPGSDDNGVLPDPGTVVVNEALTHTDLSPVGDWLELHNAGPAPVNLGGWFLSDSPTNRLKFRLPADTWIEVGGYVVFSASNHFAAATCPRPFAFSELGDEICLSSGTNAQGVLGGYRVDTDFGAAAREVPFGRYTRSDGKHDFVALRAATPGGPNALPLTGPLVISEIMYKPAGAACEYVELYNVTGAAVPLFDPLHPANTWRLAGGIAFAFPPNLTAPAHAAVLIPAAAAAVFRADYHVGRASVTIYGPFAGLLDNAGDTVRLERPGEPDVGGVPYILVEKVEYDSAPPWPAPDSAGGFSLERRLRAAYGNDPANWTLVAGGTVLPQPRTDSDGDGAPDLWESANRLDPCVADNAAGDYDRDGVADQAEYVAGTNPTNAASAFALRLSLSGSAPVLSFERQAVQGTGYDGATRWYDVLRCTNLADPVWLPVLQNLTGSGPYSLPLPAGDGPRAVYRGRVRLVTP